MNSGEQFTAVESLTEPVIIVESGTHLNGMGAHELKLKRLQVSVALPIYRGEGQCLTVL